MRRKRYKSIQNYHVPFHAGVAWELEAGAAAAQAAFGLGAAPPPRPAELQFVDAKTGTAKPLSFPNRWDTVKWERAQLSPRHPSGFALPEGAAGPSGVTKMQLCTFQY